MPQLGTQTDGSPYTRRLTTRTRRLNLYQQGLVSGDLTVLSRAPNLEIVETYAGMDEAAFWHLIEDARAAGGDLATELTRRLWSLSPEDLQRFHDQFWRLMGLPGRAVHQTVYEVHGGCSDDDFMDFRQWLITRGQDAFYAVVEDPAVIRMGGEGGIGFDEGIVSTPLYQVRDAVRTP